MTLRSANRTPLLVQPRTANLQLLQQMMPLILYLASCYDNGCSHAHPADLAAVKGVAAGCCLVMNALQVRTDCGTWRRLGAKTLELRMMSITAGVPAENGASEEGFAPQRDEALGIEVPRMQRPEPHLRRLTNRVYLPPHENIISGPTFQRQINAVGLNRHHRRWLWGL
jgi:hypothetical protein